MTTIFPDSDSSDLEINGNAADYTILSLSLSHTHINSSSSSDDGNVNAMHRRVNIFPQMRVRTKKMPSESFG